MLDSRIQFVAACDVKHGALKRWKDDKDVVTYVDYRELIARDDVDVVL
jgi:predicted dehydrogenase